MSTPRPSALTVRPARPEDLDTIAAFNSRLAEQTENVALDPETVRAGVAALLADPALGRYFLAERGGQVVGQIMLTREWSDWRNGQFWWIQSVYVRRGERRGGVFRHLFDYVRERALADPRVCGLRLYVDRGNDRAQTAYLQLGGQLTDYALMEWNLRA